MKKNSRARVRSWSGLGLGQWDKYIRSSTVYQSKKGNPSPHHKNEMVSLLFDLQVLLPSFWQNAVAMHSK